MLDLLVVLSDWRAAILVLFVVLLVRLESGDTCLVCGVVGLKKLKFCVSDSPAYGHVVGFKVCGRQPSKVSIPEILLLLVVIPCTVTESAVTLAIPRRERSCA